MFPAIFMAWHPLCDGTLPLLMEHPKCKDPESNIIMLMMLAIVKYE